MGRRDKWRFRESMGSRLPLRSGDPCLGSLSLNLGLPASAGSWVLAVSIPSSACCAYIEMLDYNKWLSLTQPLNAGGTLHVILFAFCASKDIPLSRNNFPGVHQIAHHPRAGKYSVTAVIYIYSFHLTLDISRVFYLMMVCLISKPTCIWISYSQLLQGGESLRR